MGLIPLAPFCLGVNDLLQLPSDPGKAIALQNEVRKLVKIGNYIDIASVRLIGGVDVAYLGKGASHACAVAVVWDRFSGEVLESVYAQDEVVFPYIPGLLSFRELPVVMKACEGLSNIVDVWMVDGAGIAHPRRLGIAAHFGVLLDRPSIGVAKSRLIGSHLPVPRSKGSWVPLRRDGEVIGHVLRTRDDVKPLYISPGHKVSFRQAVELVLACCPKYRLPEPTRMAHNLVERYAHSS